MSKKKKITIGFIIIFFLLILWFFDFLEVRNYTFALENIRAGKELKSNFINKKDKFYELVPILDSSSPIDFQIWEKDSIFIQFHDTTNLIYSNFYDSIYNMNYLKNTNFNINENNCLEVYNSDTITVCSNEWEVLFQGHYKDERIDNLLEYYGWNRFDFNSLVEKTMELDCNGISSKDGNFILSYKIVSYYEPSPGFFNCFGHSDGYFDYLYTAKPDSFYWKNSIQHYENNFYGIKHWSFN